MPTPYNRYGMPNGGYAQNALRRSLSSNPNSVDPNQANPIANALNHTGTPGGAPDPPQTITPMLKTGQPNLQFNPLMNALGHHNTPEPPPGTAPPPPQTAGPNPVVPPQPPPTPGSPPQNTIGPNPATPTPSGAPPFPQTIGANPATPNPLDTVFGPHDNGDFDGRDAMQVIRNAYRLYLGRDASQEEIMSQLQGQGWHPDGTPAMGRVGQSGLNSVLGYIQNSPEAAAYRNRPQATTPPPTTTTTTASATPAYLQTLLNQGLSPQDAVARFNRETGRTTGNEAVYYANNNTIGLPEAYLAGGDGGWQIVQRQPEHGSSGGGGGNRFVDPSAFINTNSALQGALLGGRNFSDTNYSQQLLQQVIQSLALQNALFTPNNGRP